MARDHAGLEAARLERQLRREAAVVGLVARERLRPLAHARIAERAQVVAGRERHAQRHGVGRRARAARRDGRGAAPDQRGRACARERIAVRLDVGGGAERCVGGGLIHGGW